MCDHLKLDPFAPSGLIYANGMPLQTMSGLLGGIGGQLQGPGAYVTTTAATGTSLGVNDITLGVPPAPSPVIKKPEDEIAWLRRRVKEVLWQP